MQGFKEYFYEAIIIPTSCKQFGTYSMNQGYWVQGAGSNLGCHKKYKPKMLKMRFEGLAGNPGTEFSYAGTNKNRNVGAGGGPGQAPAPPAKIDMAKDNSGAGGGSGKAPPPPNKPNTKGCGGGPASGECNQKSAGCSGYMCGNKATSQAGAETTTETPAPEQK